MSDVSVDSPAELASNEAFKEIVENIRLNRSFILDAGAGAGKTYSLVKALNYILNQRGFDLQRKRQQVACITFTNVAKEEIRSRTDKSPIIFAETIHSFAWEIVKGFQTQIKKTLPLIGKWPERLGTVEDWSQFKVNYDLGFPKISNEEILLSHDDVLQIFVSLMSESKFRNLLVQKFPIIFIDEYQDTNQGFVESLLDNFVDQKQEILIGFFGDPWQKIYGSNSCGSIDNPNLKLISKRANFRSVESIVRVLNRIREDLPQEVSSRGSTGDLLVYTTNNWNGVRRNEAHWKGDLPSEEAHKALDNVKDILLSRGWDLSPSRTKILMLTHGLLASEQGYKELADVFDRSDSYIKREDDYINYFSTQLEPAINFYIQKKTGMMFSALNRDNSQISGVLDKKLWTESFNKMVEIRNSGTIGEMLDHLLHAKVPGLPEKIARKESKFRAIKDSLNEQISELDLKFLERQTKLRKVQFKELVALTSFVEEMTPFATQHGVKGAEFDNVLVVFGRGWNQYNFNQMLEWANNGIPKDKIESFERNRNLFYVACSRAKINLALLFTHELTSPAFEKLQDWFEGANFIDIYSDS